MDKLTTLIFDIVVAVIITFVSVMIYFGLRSEAVITTMDTEITENFLSETKEKGSMTASDYENYMYQLSLTGVIYDVLLEHRFNSLEPEYRMRSIEEIIATQKAAYNGENIYHYKDIITHPPTVTDPIDNSGLTMNTETNESILAGAVNTPSTGHVHTDACYAGHKHSGSNTFTHIHAHTSSCNRFINRVMNDVKCNNCGYSYRWTCAVYYWNPAYGQTLSYFNADPLQHCAKCNSTSLNVGVNINDYGYSCYYNIDENNDGLYDSVSIGVNKTYYGYSAPQSDAKASYTSGCYTYHQTKSYKSLFSYDPYGGSVLNMDAAISSFLYSDPSSFCEIPYWFSVSWQNNSSSDHCMLQYVASVQANGQVLYYFNYYRDYLREPYENNINPGFPNGITALQLQDIFYGGFGYTFYKALGVDRSVSQGTFTRNMGGEIAVCSYNHSLGVNQWITTCGQVENATLVCPDKVVSIVPTNLLQSIYTNERLITTVRAIYQDGSKRTVLANTTFTTGIPVLNKTVTLNYTDNLGATKSCSITVNVVPRIKVCPNGHTYNLNTDGSDPSCIFCHAYIRTLKIINPVTSTWTITIGTGLSDNGLKLLVTYLDGHIETLTAGYEDNLDQQYLGTKMVTIGYKGATTQILVTTVCVKLRCDICGFVYELYPDGSNPGCPRCISKTPVFKGNVLNYDTVNYTEDILEDLYQDGIYRFNKDDTLSITIKNKSSSISRKLLRKIFPNMSKTWLHLEESETIQSK